MLNDELTNTLAEHPLWPRLAAVQAGHVAVVKSSVWRQISHLADGQVTVLPITRPGPEVDPATVRIDPK